MTSARLTAILLAVVCAAAACAQLELSSVQPLQVDFAGTRLIDGMSLDPEAAIEARSWPVAVEGWASVTHRWLPQSGSRLRQEIAIRPDRFEQGREHVDDLD